MTWYFFAYNRSRFFLTYIYLSKHKYNKKYKVPHKTTQDEKYVHKRTEQIETNVNPPPPKKKIYILHSTHKGKTLN